MIGSIIDYIREYGNVSFKEMRFNEVDAAILSKLSYFHFDNFVPGPEAVMPAVALSSIMLMEKHDELFGNTRYENKHRELVEGMLAGKRFADIRIAAFSNYNDKESQTQFSAVTFLLNSKRMFIAFRGTDNTIVGLKEDFNLLYMDQAPCHEHALNYIRTICKRYSREFYIGGHSKGGHLAVYAGMFLEPELQKKTRKIYSFDGLGQRETVIGRGNFDAIADKIYKLIPQASVIGMMLEDKEKYEVIKSSGNVLAQHNIYSWSVENNKFKRVQGLNGRTVLMDRTLNGWLESQSDEKRKLFIDSVYSVIEGCEAEEINDLTEGKMKRLNQLIGGIKGVDEETAAGVRKVLRAFIESAHLNLKHDLSENIKKSADRERKKIITAAEKAKKELDMSRKRAVARLKATVEK